MEFTVFTSHYLSEAFKFYLPVLIANLMIYLVSSILKSDIPIDNHIKFKNKRIIGNSRTVAGFFFFISISMLVALIQKRPLVEGFYLGSGGVLGCYCNSFIKRRVKIKEGGYIIFLDQLDFIVGSTLIYLTQFELKKEIILIGMIITFFIHHIVNLFRKTWEKLIQKYI